MSRSAELEQAYLQTSYWVDALPAPIALRIGEHSGALDRLLNRRRVRHWAFLTAWNPRSRRLAGWRNVARQSRLLRELRAQGYEWIDGIGQGDSGDWPAEPSVLVLGMRPHHALGLGRRFGQHAVVIGKLAAKPVLRWCAR